MTATPGAPAAKITASRAVVVIEDLASKNGTYVRGVRIAFPTGLEHGDELRIGRVKFVFRIEDQPHGTDWPWKLP